MHRRLLLTPGLLAALSCSNVSLLGISADDDDKHAQAGADLSTQVAAEPLRSEIVIRGADNEFLQMSRSTLGDVDGDGFDDFMVEGPSYSGSHAHLFYGKRSFATQLSTADADVVFAAGDVPSAALGDIDGDGLADFALGHRDGSELVLGSATRLAGARMPYASGVPWNLAQAEPLHVRKLGDVNGDGLDEFVVSVFALLPASEPAGNPLEVITDYMIAGRRDAWPSGDWDPSWAVAALGDEPPDSEDKLPQRLSISGCADLDGDGYDDIMALGRARMWVFYGSKNGFHDMLTPDQADASISWPYNADESDVYRAQFAKTLPFILGDADGDGTAEIALPRGAELGIVYGTKQRWSGAVQLEPDLTVALANSMLSERNWWLAARQELAYGAPQAETVVAQIKVGVADLDGDSRAELILQESRVPSPPSAYESTKFTTYVLSGASQHATGRYLLRDSDVYKPKGVSGTQALDQGTLLDSGGDFDGDGSVDLMFGVEISPATRDRETFLHLLPGTVHNPD